MNKDLYLTKEQKQWLNTHGPLKAEQLEQIFTNSVEDQEKLLQQAEEIKAER